MFVEVNENSWAIWPHTHLAVKTRLPFTNLPLFAGTTNTFFSQLK